MPYTEEEIAALREQADQLREDIADAEASKAAEVRDASNDFEGQLIEAEVARLERELAIAKGQPAPVQPPNLDEPGATETSVSAPPVTTPAPFGQNPSEATYNSDAGETPDSATDKE